MKYKLGELIDSESKKFDFSKKASVMFVNTGDVFDGKITGVELQVDKLPGQAKKSIRNGDILFSEIRPKNKRFALVDNLDVENYVVSTKLMVLRNKKTDLLNIKYMYYFLTSPVMIEYLQSEAEGRSGTFPQITFKENIANILIDLPALEEQEKIINKLDALDNKLQINKQLNDNLGKLIDLDFNKTLGNNSLESVTIDNLGSIIGGGTPSKKIAEYWNGDIPWITPKDLSKSKRLFTSSGNLWITNEGLAKSSAKILPIGTVLYSSRAPIGYISIADNPITTNQGFKSIVPNKGYSTEFIFELLKKETDNLINSANGSTFKEISGTQLKNHIVKIPTKLVCQQFSERVQPMFRIIRKLEQENFVLLQIKELLLNKFF